MKHLFTFLSVSCLLLFILASCTTSNPVPPQQATGIGAGNSGNGGGTGAFSCKINGQTFIASTTYAFKEGDGITIRGVDSTGRLVSLELDDRNLGNHTLYFRGTDQGMYKALGVSLFQHSTSSIYSLNNGDIQLASLNSNQGTASGYFSFKALDVVSNTTVDITNGIFTAVQVYESLQALQVNNQSYLFGSMSVLDNGIMWKPTQVFGTANTATNRLDIIGQNADGLKVLGFNLPLDTPPGTYLIDTLQSNYNFSFIDVNEPGGIGTDYLEYAGSLTITQNDPILQDVKGYFNCEFRHLDSTAYPHRFFTNGAFKVRYVKP